MLTDLRSISTSSSTISPKFSTAAAVDGGNDVLPQGGGNALKRFRMYSPPPLPTRLPTPPPPPKTLQDFPNLTATNQDPLLVRALVSVSDADEASDLTFQIGQEIKVTTLTPHWCWGQYEGEDGVLQAGVLSKHCVEVVIQVETSEALEKAKPQDGEEGEDDYLKDLEACYMSVEDDGFRL